jgi:hypothetical protein
MNRNELAVGQLVTVATEVEFWNESGNLDYRADRWAPFRIENIVDAGEDYVTLDLTCQDGVVTGWEVQLDLDYDDIELVK